MRSEVASKIHNETPESIKSEVREMANAIVFDANTFGPDEVPIDNSTVLIDMTGERIDSEYALGYYNHVKKHWIVDGCEVVFGGRWSFLPLAIYDTNPELRKTIKRT